MKTPPVVVDIYSWIAATAQHGYIPFEGIYRHAHALALEFQPVAYLTKEEQADPAKFSKWEHAKRLLEIFTAKVFRIYTDAESIAKDGVKYWLSIALDSPSPVLPALKSFNIWRCAVLHDTMAFDGLFGVGNLSTFIFGSAHNDLLLPVSMTAWREYCACAVPDKIKNFVTYGCFHAFKHRRGALTKGNYSVNVGTVYPRKMSALSAASSSCSTHVHVGRFVKSDNDPLWSALIRADKLTVTGFVTDEEMFNLVGHAQEFINLSSREGFSMTPLEAILLGVTRITLSSIPVHKEIYGNYNINWIDNPINPKKFITPGQREELFERWTFARVILPFKKFIK